MNYSAMSSESILIPMNTNQRENVNQKKDNWKENPNGNCKQSKLHFLKIDKELQRWKII